MTHGLLTIAHGKNLSIDVRKIIVKKQEEGLGYRKISTELRIPVSTIGVIIGKTVARFTIIRAPADSRKLVQGLVNGLLEK